MAKKRFVVTGDVTFAFVTSIEADSEEEAELLVNEQLAKDIPYDTSKAAMILDVQDVYEDG